jgi:hypothetical protein
VRRFQIRAMAFGTDAGRELLWSRGWN